MRLRNLPKTDQEIFDDLSLRNADVHQMAKDGCDVPLAKPGVWHDDRLRPWDVSVDGEFHNRSVNPDYDLPLRCPYGDNMLYPHHFYNPWMRFGVPIGSYGPTRFNSSAHRQTYDEWRDYTVTWISYRSLDESNEMEGCIYNKCEMWDAVQLVLHGAYGPTADMFKRG